jgi:thiosulfate/3-mercaptopyruvate sulfurtransferase
MLSVMVCGFAFALVSVSSDSCIVPPASPLAIPAFAPGDPPIQVVSTSWLASHLADRDLVVVQVEMNANATSPRIPGARVLAYGAMTVSRNGVSTELPDADSLASVFAALGISDSSLVVVTTSHEAPMAARALMSLDYIGHRRLAFLDGGVAKWIREGRPTASNALQVTRGNLKPNVGTPSSSTPRGFRAASPRRAWR